jgi:hypothetical protein
MDGVKILSSGIPALEFQPRSSRVEWIRGLLYSSILVEYARSIHVSYRRHKVSIKVSMICYSSYKLIEVDSVPRA